MHIIGPGIWPKNLKNMGNETHTHYRTQNMVRNTEKRGK